MEDSNINKASTEQEGNVKAANGRYCASTILKDMPRDMPDALKPGCDENLEADPDAADPEAVRFYAARVCYVPTWRDKLRSLMRRLASKFGYAKKPKFDKPAASYEDALKRIPDDDLRRYVAGMVNAPECRDPKPLDKMIELTRRLHRPDCGKRKS